MIALGIRKVYEESMARWLTRARPLSKEETIAAIFEAAKASPPNNQIYLTSDCVQAETVEWLRDEGFTVTLETGEDRVLYSVSF